MMSLSRICFIITVVLIQCLTQASGEDEPSADEIYNQAVSETNMQKDEEEKMVNSNMTGLNKAASRISAFLSSSPYIKRVSYSTRSQLNAIKKMLRLTGLKGLKLYKKMRRKFGKSVMPRRLQKILSDGDFPEPTVDECPFADVECIKDVKYRSIDGTCNNLRYPNDGRANRALARFLPAHYEDGVEEPRLAKSGNPLPSAREVSLVIYEDEQKESGVHTVMLMTFGQLLDHDVDKTAVAKLLKENDTMEDYNCSCGNEQYISECFNIPCYGHDPDFEEPCLEFVRSQEYMKDNCEIGPREQPNTITSWLDASFVYGSSLAELKKIRDYDDPDRGRLRVYPHPQGYKPLLPQQNDSACRDVDGHNITCFLAGDRRRNEQVGLIAMHIVFVRLHNFIEKHLRRVNRNWGGDKLFYETRKLLIGLWQNMVYNEYLPIVLGPTYMNKYKLTLEKEGYFEGYDNTVHGDTTNVFATAAFRFGHSQVGKFFRFAHPNYRNFTELHFSEVLFRPKPIYESPINGISGVDASIFGMISQPVEHSDRFFSKEMSAKLFSEKPPKKSGTDLPALNTQRGRDHGIPGYTKWREFCGLSVAKDFDELDDIPKKVQEKLRSLYEHVDDIDLFPAAMSEDPVVGALVGPTFACIIAHQFRNFKVADRFWFETNDPDLGFTPDQLKNIKGYTLSRAFCDTLDDVHRIQKYSMLQPKKFAMQNHLFDDYTIIHWHTVSQIYKGETNRRKHCRKLKKLDFKLWKEQTN